MGGHEAGVVGDHNHAGAFQLGMEMIDELTFRGSIHVSSPCCEASFAKLRGLHLAARPASGIGRRVVCPRSRAPLERRHGADPEGSNRMRGLRLKSDPLLSHAGSPGRDFGRPANGLAPTVSDSFEPELESPGPGFPGCPGIRKNLRPRVPTKRSRCRA
ncbi:hypothetical protein HYPGJ_30106 [Hyphomicrobium sp. GJ21]|nr:hypothetical protein HYPGJ_30106 [Hyphomicrobium sp. GJ21]